MTTLAVRAREQAIERTHRPARTATRVVAGGGPGDRVANRSPSGSARRSADEQAHALEVDHRPRARRGPDRTRGHRQGRRDRRRRPSRAAHRTRDVRDRRVRVHRAAPRAKTAPRSPGRRSRSTRWSRASSTAASHIDTRHDRSTSTRPAWPTPTAWSGSPRWSSGPARSSCRSATARSSPRSARAACSTGSPDIAPTRAALERPAHARPRLSSERGQICAPAASDRAMAHYLAPRPAAHERHPRPGRRASRPATGRSSPRHSRSSEVALISDASNLEIDRLNARAQHYRAERGELGDIEVQSPASTTASARVTGSR